MSKVLPEAMEQYKKQVQQMQCLIYDSDRLTNEESNSLKRGIQYVQAKIKLTYFQHLYHNSKTREYLNSWLKTKQENVDRILTDAYCNKSVLSSFDSRSGLDLYNNYYRDLKSYQQILKQEFFDNLVSELIQEANVDDLKALCEKSLNADIVNNLDAVYKILNDRILGQNIPVCVEQQKNISYLGYCLRMSEDDINNLQFKLDNYSKLSDFQHYLENLYDQDIVCLGRRISELRFNKSFLGLELKELVQRRQKYANSNIFLKALKYREKTKEDNRIDQLVATILSVENEENSYREQLELLIKTARKKLIEYIEANDATLFQDYIDKIKKCTSRSDIVDSQDFFIYSLYNYDQLVKQQQLKKEHLIHIRQELEESKAQYSESIAIYDDTIGDNSKLLNKIMEVQNMNGLTGISPIIYIYLLKLINDTDKLSFEDILLLLDEEDIIKIQDEYKQLIESYLEIEKKHIDDLYFNYQFQKNTEDNAEEELGFVKIKI